jgi:hypothetical protein
MEHMGSHIRLGQPSDLVERTEILFMRIISKAGHRFKRTALLTNDVAYAGLRNIRPEFMVTLESECQLSASSGGVGIRCTFPTVIVHV